MGRKRQLKVKKKYTPYLDAFENHDIVPVRDFGHYSALKRMVEAIDKEAIRFDRLGYNLFAMTCRGSKPRKVHENEYNTFYDL